MQTIVKDKVKQMEEVRPGRKVFRLVGGFALGGAVGLSALSGVAVEAISVTVLLFATTLCRCGCLSVERQRFSVVGV